MTRKTCSKCGIAKRIDAFHRQKTSHDGRMPRCKSCRSSERVGQNAKAASKNRARSKRYYEQVRRYSRMEKVYGITKDFYESLLWAQQGACAICRKSIKGREIHIDHNHLSGNVRGLLCRKCNFGIGCFEDDGNRMAAAIDYVTGRSLTHGGYTL